MRAFDFAKFLAAQDLAYDDAIRELRAGRKESHWMWFVFPQVPMPKQSDWSLRYAIPSLNEAQAYLAHPVLGPRLRECTQALLDLGGVPILQVMDGSYVDVMKLRSSMTLFSLAAPVDPLFTGVLECYFHGEPDPETVRFLVSGG